MPIYFRTTPVREPFAFESIGNEWNQEMITRPKGYPFYHYLQTESGEGEITIQGRPYLLREGEGVMIAPFVSHAYRKKSPRWRTCFATVTGSMESGIAAMLGNRQVIFVEREVGEILHGKIDEIVSKWRAAGGDTSRLSVLCYEFLLYFVDGIHAEEDKEQPLYRRYVKPVIKEIERGYGEELTVQRLSEMVYVTPQYLTRLFRRFLGCTVYEYLTNYRITKAKESLITQGDRRVGDIGADVGFQDTSHFISMFRKTAGMTPREFRKMNGGA